MRVAGLLAGLRFEVIAGFAGGVFVFRELFGGEFAGAAEEIGAEGAGLDDRDVHAEGFHLPGKCFAEALDRVVEAPARPADEAADGGEIEDVSSAALAEVGQEGARGANQAVDIGLKHGLELFFRDFFYRAIQAVAGVVHEDIDVTEGGNGLLGHRGAELLVHQNAGLLLGHSLREGQAEPFVNH